MRIRIVTPVPRGSTRGNGVTARRWHDMLRSLGHEVELNPDTEAQAPDLIIALHAEQSHDAVVAFRERHPKGKVIVAMTGTDLYQALPESEAARRTLERADLVVVLHPAAFQDLPAEFRSRARLVIQSASPPPDNPPPRQDGRFQVCVLAHLRTIKQPLLAAAAARQLPEDSRIQVVLAGGVLEESLAAEAAREQDHNPRFRWLGEISPDQALELVASSDLMVMSSELEGGANVISEALACGVPVLATRISAANGMLGHDYPGLFQVGNVQALADLMHRAEVDEAFRNELKMSCSASRPLVDPRRERSSLACLVAELESDI